MSEDNKTEDNRQILDLSELSEMKFQTAWTPVSKFSDNSDRRGGGKFRPSRQRDGQPKRFERDQKEPRREGLKKRFSEKGEKSAPRGRGERGDKVRSRKNFEKHTPFVPTMEVLFYPDDAPFNKLLNVMKTSKRTYQLFDIAHLVLEKFDRAVILAKNLPDAEGKVAPLYCAQPSNIPFENEADAKRAALDAYVKEMFVRETVECEAPKGNFQVVNKCTITGELLGAPNWHRYGEFLREYHANKCANMSFEAFTSSIESVRDPEQIEAWLNQMKTRSVYRLKEVVEGEQEVFDTLEAATNYVAHKKATELVKTYEQVRLKGVNMDMLPRGRIRKNIEDAWFKQRKFPIVTANNLRGRLRRSGLAVYKRGSKSFAFVSAIKRKFLIEGEKLSDMPQKVFDFITENAGISAAELPFKMLGIEAPQKALNTDVEKLNATAEEKPEEVTSPETTAESENKNIVCEEKKAEFNAIVTELSWLISEGYVVEYADSTLQANPYMPKPKDKSANAEEPEVKADEPLTSQTEKTVTEEKMEEIPQEEVSSEE